MSKKIFISYKYADSKVAPLETEIVTQGRHYVTLLANYLKNIGYIYKGEKDDESLEHFKNETIQSKLKAKIFDSSLTIVLLSKGMKDPSKDENNQWIPWEIAYSLKEMSKNGVRSRTNSMLAIVLPDENHDYSYMVNNHDCVTKWNTDNLFSILRKNMFNRNDKKLIFCTTCNGEHHTGNDHSYIFPVKWKDFVSNVDYHINHATNLNKNLHHFNITKTV